jgi:hypothetical protein
LTDELPAVDVSDKSGTLTVEGQGVGDVSEKEDDSFDILDSDLLS